MAKTVAEEKDTVDYVTDAMYSLSFLEYLNTLIFSNPGSVAAQRIYRDWINAAGAPEPKMPFSLGAFVGYMFCGLLITKENWSDLLPRVEAASAPADWGLGGAAFLTPLTANPSLGYVVRRLRNSLGHTNFTFNLPPANSIGSDFGKVHDLTTITFKDVDPRNPADTFETTLTMRQVETLIQRFHREVHQSVAVKT